jgi:hypothetical protein
LLGAAARAASSASPSGTRRATTRR